MFTRLFLLFLNVILLNMALFFGCNGTNFYGATVLKNQTIHDLNVSGNAQLDHVTVTGNVKMNGPAILNTVTVTKDMHVNGPLTATKLNVHGKLHVNGAVIIKDSQVAQVTSVYGYFEAQKSVLHNIDISAKRLVLRNSHVVRSPLEEMDPKIWM